MPNKHNADRRHHFGKMRFKLRNWASYDAGLRRRGSLTLWVTDEAIAKWQAPPRLNPGGQAHYSDMAIKTALMLRLTFHLPLRQTEGFMKSIFALLGVTVSAPDHSTLSRRTTRLASVSVKTPPTRAIAFQIWTRRLARKALLHPALLILRRFEIFDGVDGPRSPASMCHNVVVVERHN
jgi:hypothetical protein